jgi:hypothetical protein
MSCLHRADDVQTVEIHTLLGPCLVQEWASRCFGPELLVGLRCASTCHTVSPNLPPGLVRLVFSASFLEVLMHGRDVDGAPNQAPHTGQVHGDFGLVLMTIGTQGTTLYRLERPKEGSAMTWPTI